jgi:putative transposase
VIAALDRAVQHGAPEVFNSDQGAQFTSSVFTTKLKEHDIQISMDGRGRALDNIFVERLWRSVKYEEVYLKDYRYVPDAITGLGRTSSSTIGSAFINRWITRRRKRSIGKA